MAMSPLISQTEEARNGGGRVGGRDEEDEKYKAEHRKERETESKA